MSLKLRDVLVIAALLAPAVARGQERTDSNLTLLDLTIDPTVNEPYRVFLAKGVVYRASFDQPGVTMRMRSYEQKQLPFLVPVTQTQDASGRSEFEIYPQSDGEIEFRAVFNELRVPVRFRLWSDSRATARGRRSAEEGYWEAGLEVAGGVLSAANAEDDEMSTDGSVLSACFSFRNGPGLLGRVNGCAFGIEVPQEEADVLNISFFMEPRIRLLGPGSKHEGWSTEAGVLLHAGIGEGADANATSFTFGGGAYVARDLRQGSEGSGWRILGMVRYDHISNAIAGPLVGFDRTYFAMRAISGRVGLGYYF